MDGNQESALRDGISSPPCRWGSGGFFIRRKGIAFFLLLLPLLWAVRHYAFNPVLDERTFFFKEGDYYTIKLKGDSGDGKERLVTLHLDNLTHSCSALDNPFRLEYRYLRSYEEVVRWKATEKDSLKTLFIGGGGYAFPRFVEARYPNAEIDVVEIDPVVIQVSQTYMGVLKTFRIRTFNETDDGL